MPQILFRFGVGVFVCFLVLTTSHLAAANLATSYNYTNQKLFARSLFLEKDYYRTISEIYRIKFHYSDSLDPELELMLLESYFHSDQHNKVIHTSKHLLLKDEILANSQLQYRIGVLYSATLLGNRKVAQASQVWERYCQTIDKEQFPDGHSLPKPIDPEKAKLYSAFLPGSGLLLSREYGKAAVSFLLNTAFLAGIYLYGSDQQYGIAGLLTFFEFGWYFGGQNAAYESAKNYNRKHVLGAQQAWIARKID